jgi:cytosine/uracil/thiamine/allantoin permease
VSNVSARVDAGAAESRVAADSRLYNEDLAPVPPEKRTWRTINYLTLWVGMSSQIPTYLVAGGLIALAWGGYAISAIHGLTDYGWFVGFFVSGIAYLGLARLGLAAPRARGAPARGGAWRATARSSSPSTGR